MKPLHLIASLVFLLISTWVVSSSERTVRGFQVTYYKLISPFIKAGSAFDQKTKLFFSEVQTSQQLEKRLVAIESEFGPLQATEARYKQIEAENARLRSALDIKTRSKFMLTSAKVVRRSPATWWETITIDKGGDNRLAPQIPVISEQGLVGKVDRVFNDLSTVLLLTDESCLISAKVDGTPEHGIISGQRGKYGEESLLRLKYLTNDISVPQGTKVYTSGKGGVFPDNILIGTIVSIETGALYAEALVKPSFNLDESEVVFAIVNDQ